MALRIEQRYNIKIACTDDYDVYKQYKIANQHLITKAETCLVESKNSLIRHYLARLNGKIKRYSKSIEMVYNYLVLLFNWDLLMSMIWLAMPLEEIARLIAF